MSRPSIALAMICKNEVHNLPVLFDSVKGCFDEIHITDTGSTDGTLEYLSDLVKSGKDKDVLGCPLKLHFFEWINDFGAARNASFSHVKTDFVMWMDADDSLSNKESFILWRDNAMSLADYWLATYHYAFDGDRPICSFARERVVRNVQKDVWHYFVHEGIKPQPEWRPQYCITWAIHHRRTMADITKDKGRNLALFEKNKDKLDSRMTHYYGKELFENGRPMEAFGPLMEAITRPDLEIHDRMLGIMYAGYSSLQCNQPDRAIELAYQGLRLDPNRAEYWAILGDAYLKKQDLKNAIPFFHAAKTCFNSAPPQAKYQGAIYSNELAYSKYPVESLAKIYYAQARFDLSERECREGIEKHSSDICKQLLVEIQQARNLTEPDRSKCVDTEEIVISTSPQGAYPWDSNIYKEKGLGGSETAAVEMATWLAKKTKHKVIVFNPREDVFKDDHGVEYRPVKDLLTYFAKYKPKLHIAWRHNTKVTDAPTYSWCHDLVLQGAENGLNVDGVLCLTEFHKNYLKAIQGIPDDKLILTRNGINPNRFSSLRKKNPNKVIFSSSPDRGLDRAILVVEEARKSLPDLEMHVFYGLENLEKYGLSELAKKLKQMIADRPWVKYHGNVDQSRLANEMMESGTALYVPDFIESFFITGLELAAAGCYLITRKIGAIQNTVKPFADMGMATILDMGGDTEEERKVWAAQLVDAVQRRLWEKITLSDEELERYSWSSVADEWIELFDLEEKRVLKPVSYYDDDHLDGVAAI